MSNREREQFLHHLKYITSRQNAWYSRAVKLFRSMFHVINLKIKFLRCKSNAKLCSDDVIRIRWAPKFSSVGILQIYYYYVTIIHFFDLTFVKEMKWWKCTKIIYFSSQSTLCQTAMVRTPECSRHINLTVASCFIYRNLKRLSKMIFL